MYRIGPDAAGLMAPRMERTFLPMWPVTTQAREEPEHYPSAATPRVVSAELISILAVGVSLAGLVLTVGGMAIAAIRALSALLGGLETRMGALEQRQARLEGLIEGSGLFRPPTVPVKAPAAGPGD